MPRLKCNLLDGRGHKWPFYCAAIIILNPNVVNILQRKNRKGDKINFYYDFGRGPGQRPSTGIFIFVKPASQVQKNHNKEALALLEVKKSQIIIEQQATGTPFIPSHKFKKNFLEYYEEFDTKNSRKGGRHLHNSLTQFKLFTKSSFVAPIDITENTCKSKLDVFLVQ